jgi:cation:H+ antiporter
MGVFILALITSCPELVTSLTSVTAVNAPDLAAGDLVGADMFNIFAIALLGILCGKGSILTGQSKTNIFTLALTIVMLLVIIGFISLTHFAGLRPVIFNVSLGSIIIGLIYIIWSYIIFKTGVSEEQSNSKKGITKALISKFIISAAVIITAGIWLAHIGKAIADFYGWSEMYVGVLLIAFATTMPEFVVSLTALKLNSIHMATGNLLGSNIFNLFIIVVLDIVLRRGDFFSSVSKMNIFPAALAVLLSAIAIVSMYKKPKKKLLRRYFSWDSAAIIAAFLAGHYLIFNLVRTIKW